jgi:electron transfer flavoprotein alpha subunit
VTGRALVVVDHLDGVIGAGQLGVVSQAGALCETVEALLFGPPSEAAVAELGRHGVAVVHVASSELLNVPVAQPRVEVLVDLQRREGFDVVLLENSSLAADLAAAAAVRLDAGVNWDLTAIELRDGSFVGTRVALQDTVVVDVGWAGSPALAVFRVGQLEPVPAAEPLVPTTRDVTLQPSPLACAVRVIRRDDSTVVPTGLDTADIIVAGGRGLGGPENIPLLEELADVLGGVVGVSMPVVDKGWYPYPRQIGQTGRTVRPKLYIACGISGAMQHRVGMAKSGTIVAINSDPQAPVFGFCDFGVVGDLTEVVPRLAALLRDRDSSRAEPPPQSLLDL